MMVTLTGSITSAFSDGLRPVTHVISEGEELEIDHGSSPIVMDSLAEAMLKPLPEIVSTVPPSTLPLVGVKLLTIPPRNTCGYGEVWLAETDVLRIRPGWSRVGETEAYPFPRTCTSTW